MAAQSWLGAAGAQQQVDILTVGGTIEATDVFTMTLTSERGTTQVLSVVAGSTVIADVCTAITAAWNASKQSLFSAITATAGATTVTLTADVAGVPFYVAVATTETGGGGADSQTFTRAASVANSGPNDWKTASNWSTGSVPVSSDDVDIQSGTSAILYGLDQSAVALGTLRIGMGMRGYIGTADADLRIGATTFEYGASRGVTTDAGSGRVRINFGTSNVAVTILNTAGSGADNGLPPVRLRINHASATVRVVRGQALIGGDSDEFTASQQVSAVTVGDEVSAASDPTVILAKGLTQATQTQNGGRTFADNAPTTINSNGGEVDFTRSLTPRTVTTVNPAPDRRGSLVYDSSVLTITTFNQPTGRVRVTAEAA